MAEPKVNPSNYITAVNPSNYITADGVTFSYAHLFVARPNDKGVFKYSACILLDKTDKAEKKRWDAAIEAAILKGITDGKFTANQRPILKTPIRDGDEELKMEIKKGAEYKGRWFINTSANYADRQGNPVPPPGITKPQGGIAVPILDPLEFYSGCKGRAIITFYAFNQEGSKGIAVAINGAYKTGEGDRLDGRVDAASVFNQFAEADSEDEEPASDFD